jgi:hypothetical protein
VLAKKAFIDRHEFLPPPICAFLGEESRDVLRLPDRISGAGLIIFLFFTPCFGLLVTNNREACGVHSSNCRVPPELAVPPLLGETRMRRICLCVANRSRIYNRRPPFCVGRQ